MIYMWKCAKCDHITETTRSVADIDVPPAEGCEKCNSVEVKRGIYKWSRTQVSLVHGGTSPWHDEQYIGKRGIPNGR